MVPFQPGFYVVRDLPNGRVRLIRCSTFAHAMQQCFLLDENCKVIDQHGVILKYRARP